MIWSRATGCGPAPGPWSAAANSSSCSAWCCNGACRGCGRSPRRAAVVLFVAWHLFFLAFRNPLDLWDKPVEDWCAKQGWWKDVRPYYDKTDRATRKYGNFFGIEQGWKMFPPPLARSAWFLDSEITFDDDGVETLPSDNEPDLTHYLRLGGWRGRKLETYLVWATPEELRGSRSDDLPVFAAYVRWRVRRWRETHPDDPRTPVKVKLVRHKIDLPQPGDDPTRHPDHGRHRNRHVRRRREAAMTPPPTPLTLPAPLWRRLLLAPVHFWTRPVRAEPLALFRIVFGATLLLSVLISYAPYLGLYLGGDPLLPSGQVDDWMSTNAGRFCLLRGPKNLPPFDQMPAEYADAWTHWCERPANEYLLFGVWVASLAFVTLGLWTRPSTIVALLLTVSFHLRIVQTTNGGDSVARCGLFYLMLAPAGAVWSLDAWMKRRWRSGAARRRRCSSPRGRCG